MDFSYKPRDIEQGNRNKRMAEETPNNFGELDGAAQFTPGRDLADRPSRMAGEMGARAMQMINDPAEKARTDAWMNAFGMSNQGMEFNQARMIQMAPPEPAPEQSSEPDPNKDEDPRP